MASGVGLCFGLALACGDDAPTSVSDAAVRDAAKGGDNPGGGEPDAPADPNLGLSEPEAGFIMRSVGAEVPAGQEREYCEAARIPGDPEDEYYVSFIELANGALSHHLGLAYAKPGSLAERELMALGEGNRKACQGPLLAFGDGIEMLGTAQQPYGTTQLPEGVAWKFHGGQYIVYNYHFFNSTQASIQARSAVSFHEVEPETVERLAQLFSLNNVTIDVPPGQSASFTAECHFSQDMMVGGFTRHTHQWGRDFTVWLSGGERDGEELWTSTHWESDTEFSFPEPILLRAGEGFRYQCNYENDTTRRIRFGTSVEDEMCFLYGPVWPAEGSEPLDLPDCNIVWIDDEGIGHSAAEAGGFPEPTDTQKYLCETFYGDAIDECGQCQCDSCAAPGLACFQDTDCSALASCLASCTEIDCIEQCQPVVEAHHSGHGLLTSLWHCAESKCPGCSYGLPEPG